MPSEPAPKENSRSGVLIATGVVLLLFVTLGGLAQAMSPAFGLWFVPLILFGGTTWIALRLQGYAPLQLTRATHLAASPTILGFFFGLANFFAIVVPLQILATSLAPEDLRKLYDSTQVFEGQTRVELGLIIGAVAIAAPIFEELFFRGFLQRGLARSGIPPLQAVIVSAAIFSAFHLDPVGFLARFELGILFGLLLVYTGSLWPSVAAHAANNLISTVIYFAGKQQTDAGGAEAEPSLAQIAPLVGLGAIAFISLWRWARQDPRFSAASALEDPPPVERAIPPSFFALLAPWVTAAVVGTAAMIAIDPTAVRLNLFDLQHRLPKVDEHASPEARAERAALRELRQRVRAGEAPLSEYEARRKALAESSQAGAQVHEGGAESADAADGGASSTGPEDEHDQVPIEPPIPPVPPVP